MSAKFTLEGSGQGAIDLIRKLNKELDGTEDQFDKAAKGAGRAEAAAKRLVDNVATPMERYKDKVEKLAQAVEMGALSEGKARVAADRYYAILQKTDPKMIEAVKRQEQLKAAQERSIAAQKKAAESAEREAEAQRKLGQAIRQSVETPLERYNRLFREHGKLLRANVIDKETFLRKVRQLKQEITVSSDAFKEVEVSQESSFGLAAISRIGAFVGSLGLIRAALGEIKGAYADVEVAAQRAADVTMASLSAAGETQQVAPDAVSQQQVMELRNALISKGIFAPEQDAQAYSTAFSLMGADFSQQDLAMMVHAGDTRYIKPEDLGRMGEALRTVQNTFGEEEIGNLERVLDKVIVAGAPTKADATQTALALTRIGQGARALGWTDEEATAALMVAEAKARDIDVSGTQVGSLLDQIDRRGLNQGSLRETLAHIQGRIEGGEGAFEVLGETNAVKGFRSLVQGGNAALASAEMELLNSEGRFRRDAGAGIDNNPRLRLAREIQRTRGEAFIAEEERSAEAELVMDLLRAEVERRRATGEISKFQARLDNRIIDASDALGWEERATIATLTNSAGELSQGARFELADYLRRIAEATEKSAGQGTTSTRAE